jgi:hypothetical protein
MIVALAFHITCHIITIHPDEYLDKVRRRLMKKWGIFWTKKIQLLKTCRCSFIFDKINIPVMAMLK